MFNTTSIAGVLGQDTEQEEAKATKKFSKNSSGYAKRPSAWMLNFVAQPPDPKETPREAVQRLRATMGEAPIICILGGTHFSDPDSFTLVQALASELTKQVGKQAIFVTGGMDGVQRTFAEGCGRFVKVFNLLPVSDMGKDKVFEYGIDLYAGKQLEERKAIFAELGDIYITVEGGPGVAGEARKAHSRGVAIVPLIRSGGASAGMYDFPREALKKPNYATEEQWELIRDNRALPKESAAAVGSIIQNLLESFQVEKAARANAERAAMQGARGAPPPVGVDHIDMTDAKFMARAFEMLDPRHTHVVDRPQARHFLRTVGWTLPDDQLDAMLSGATPTRSADPELKRQQLFTKMMLFEICANNQDRVNGDLQDFKEGLQALAEGDAGVKKQYLLDILIAPDGKEAAPGALTQDQAEHIFRLLGFTGDGLVDVDTLAEKLVQGVAIPPSGHEIMSSKPWTGGGIPR